jgi:hypothetical protein
MKIRRDTKTGILPVERETLKEQIDEKWLR